MPSNTFDEGDVVKCIDATGTPLTAGEMYEVERYYFWTHMVMVHGSTHTAERFVPLNYERSEIGSPWNRYDDE